MLMFWGSSGGVKGQLCFSKEELVIGRGPCSGQVFDKSMKGVHLVPAPLDGRGLDRVVWILCCVGICARSMVSKAEWLEFDVGGGGNELLICPPGICRLVIAVSGTGTGSPLASVKDGHRVPNLFSCATV